MKKIMALVFMLTLIQCTRQTSVVQVMSHGGIEREYLYHAKEDLPVNAPLVMVLHGFMGDARGLQSYTGMNQIADENGFAVVYPSGTYTPQGDSYWNANLLYPPVDDVGFLTTLVQFLQVKHDLNPQRTFVCGMSNGGFMSYTLACQSSEVFRAMASVTGTMSGGDWASCQPTRPIPVLQITGISDNIVPLDGSMASAYGFSGAPHQDSIMQMWASLNGCTTRDSSFIPNSTHAITFKGASNGHEVWHYTIEDMGHEWPGTLVIKSPRDYYPYGTVASEVIWDFFSRY